mgnify:CR=1 FL=1
MKKHQRQQRLAHGYMINGSIFFDGSHGYESGRSMIFYDDGHTDNVAFMLHAVFDTVRNKLIEIA